MSTQPIPAPSFFESIALPLVKRGWDVVPCYPNDKQVHTKLVSSPLTMKTKSVIKIQKWAAVEPFANVAVYAEQKPDGLLFLDKDGAISLRNKYEQETGKKFPRTLLVRSSIVSDGNGGTYSKGHWYFYQTPRTMALTKNLSETSTGGLFSLRVKNEYVTSIGSIHPDTGKPYEIAEDYPVLPMPDDLLDWLLKQVAEKPEKPEKTDGSPRELIPHGQIHPWMNTQAGRLHAVGLKGAALEEALLSLVHENCEPPINENKVRAMAKSHDKLYEPGDPTRGPLSMSVDKTGEQHGRTLNFVRGDSIQPVRLKWLWPNRILADKLNVFSGEPDVGKGMTTVDLAARITRGLDFPDAKNELGPRDVLFLSSEDDMEDTIVPRLKVAGADMTRIHFAEISENSSGTLTEGIVCLDRDLPVMEQMIKRHPDIVLIIPDPVISFLGDADPNKDKEVRPIYSKMKSFAKRLNVAWLFVNHWNKNQNATSINRTSGAKTMVSAPRATWMFSKSPEDPTRYLMMKGKGNLSSVGGTKTLAYRIVGVPYDFGDGKPPGEVPKLVWDGETEHSTESVLQDQADPDSRRNSKAETLLDKLLEPGAMKAKEVYIAGDREGLSSDKMKRARYRLGYAAGQIGGVWYWAKSEKDIQAEMMKQYKAFRVDLTQSDMGVEQVTNAGASTRPA